MASNTIIQCSPSTHTKRKYDVFVSFRGEDSHNNSTGFLFEALQKKGIDAFRDDAGLNKGESIAPKLLQAIEGSRLFIVVFSKNYASSTWCLRELAHICNCIEISPRHVLPIFYDVGPSEVRKQIGSYEKPLPNTKKVLVRIKRRWRNCKDWVKLLHMGPIYLVGISKISKYSCVISWWTLISIYAVSYLHVHIFHQFLVMRFSKINLLSLFKLKVRVVEEVICKLSLNF